LSAVALFAQSPVAAAQQGAARGVASRYLQLPMRFEPNADGGEQSVQFLSRGAGYTLLLSSTQAVLSLRSRVPPEHARDSRHERFRSTETASTEFTMNLVGANPEARVEGADKLSGTVNYFLGNDPNGWRTAIPTFAKVKCSEVYPGVDLVYYGNQRQLE